MDAYAGDILEHALNKGIESAAQRYGVPATEVREIVLQFKGEIEPSAEEIAQKLAILRQGTDAYWLGDETCGQRIILG